MCFVNVWLNFQDLFWKDTVWNATIGAPSSVYQSFSISGGCLRCHEHWCNYSQVFFQLVCWKIIQIITFLRKFQFRLVRPEGRCTHVALKWPKNTKHIFRCVSFLFCMSDIKLHFFICTVINCDIPGIRFSAEFCDSIWWFSTQNISFYAVLPEA